MQKSCREGLDSSHNLTPFENALMKGVTASLSLVLMLLFRVGLTIREVVTEFGLLVAMGMADPQSNRGQMAARN